MQTHTYTHKINLAKAHSPYTHTLSKQEKDQSQSKGHIESQTTRPIPTFLFNTPTLKREMASSLIENLKLAYLSFKKEKVYSFTFYLPTPTPPRK